MSKGSVEGFSDVSQTVNTHGKTLEHITVGERGEIYSWMCPQTTLLLRFNFWQEICADSVTFARKVTMKSSFSVFCKYLDPWLNRINNNNIISCKSSEVTKCKHHHLSSLMPGWKAVFNWCQLCCISVNTSPTRHHCWVCSCALAATLSSDVTVHWHTLEYTATSL